MSIPLSDIWYIEAQGRHAFLHLAEKEYELVQGISALRQELGGNPVFQQAFLAIHRSFLVNMKHVSAIEKAEVILDDGRRLTISRGMIKEVNQAFIRYYRAEM